MVLRLLLVSFAAAHSTAHAAVVLLERTSSIGYSVAGYQGQNPGSDSQSTADFEFWSQSVQRFEAPAPLARQTSWVSDSQFWFDATASISGGAGHGDGVAWTRMVVRFSTDSFTSFQLEGNFEGGNPPPAIARLSTASGIDVFNTGGSVFSATGVLAPGEYRYSISIDAVTWGYKSGTAELAFSPVPGPSSIIAIGSALLALPRRRR